MTLPTLKVHEWSSLDDATRREVLRRPAQRDQQTIMAAAREIVDRVRRQGEAAVLELTAEFDHVQLDELRVGEAEFEEAAAALSDTEKRAIETAIGTVSAFHRAQAQESLRVETAPGVVCERHYLPLQAIGMYVPAGTAPLPSSALMIGVPARIAGCPTRVLCSPPRTDGRLDPGVLFTARACGATHVFKAGGAQAIAAMAFGTRSIPKVDKIFGPGNAWVTAAKQIVAGDPDGAAYDMPAGPSEVLVVADASARAEFVAADLLAQAEHSVDAQVLLVTTSRELAAATQAEIRRQLSRLSRGEVISRSLAESRIILVDNLDAALDVANRYAPEHLIIQAANPRQWLAQVRHAGSVFLGEWTPEPMGDYCSGTNHVLPTYGYARSFSGLSLSDFMRSMTVQELTPQGIAGLGPVAETLAMLEGLDAHANAVAVRLASLREQPG